MDSNAPRPRRAWYQWHWFTWIVVLGLAATFSAGNLAGIVTGRPARLGPLVWSGGFPLRYLGAADDASVPRVEFPGMLALNVLIAGILMGGAVCYLERRFWGMRSRFSVGGLLTAVTFVALFCALVRWEPALIQIPICGLMLLGAVGVLDTTLWLLGLPCRRLWGRIRRGQ